MLIFFLRALSSDFFFFFYGNVWYVDPCQKYLSNNILRITASCRVPTPLQKDDDGISRESRYLFIYLFILKQYGREGIEKGMSHRWQSRNNEKHS